ncbi:MAG TPA: aspartate aminotransferase family protein, partial [Acetobacteraceae bacterium]|nr:aspartate aminotransferase family protein [Acetobacteraceae bacterium]
GALELVADKAARQNFDPALKVGGRAAKLLEANGVIGRAIVNDVLAFSPPLVITEAEIDEMLDGFTRALDELAGQLRREHLSVVR